MHDAHHLLILHGRYTCTARNPKCGECCIVDLCEYAHKIIPKIHLMAGEAMTEKGIAGEAI